MYLSHPLIRENTIESRLYQEVIVGNASQNNTLVVAPTALGKTVIAILLATHRLEKVPEGRVLMISTTRPLVNQHSNSFKKFLNIPEDKIVVFTGYTPPKDRKELWRNSRVICATPQVIENDLISGKYSMDKVSLIIFDEAHRSSGDYPYAFIAQRYVKGAEHQLILGLTASPGGDETRIAEVCENLFIKNIEVRTERDIDVKPYIKGIKIEWRKVELPEAFEKIKDNLEGALKDRLVKLKRLGLSRSASISVPKKDFLALREKLQSSLAKEGGTPETYIGLSAVAACINLAHALELLETQELATLLKYFGRLQKGRSKAVKGLLQDVKVLRAIRLTENLSKKMHHPKLDVLVEIITKESKKKIIVFSQFRDTAMKIVEELKGIDGVKPVRFVGQASKEGDKGLTQRQQLEILDKFHSGEYSVLVATSVAEEGLDIPKVDLVLFYEPVPSEIRSIQRRGRTGRSRAGRVIVLMTKKSRDEGFYWSSFHRERRMRVILERLKDKHYKPKMEVDQKQLQDFFEVSHTIVIDSRELASNVARELLKHGIVSKPKLLDVGDYILSDRVGVERKTAEDFLQSIIDKRLLEQVLRLRQSYARPLMIIEGAGLYSKRGVHPNAVRGALASIAIDFGISIIFTRDEKDTAGLLAVIVKRERKEGREEIQIRGDKRVLTLGEQQESIIAGLPKVNIVLARRLLQEFKSVEKVFSADEEELTSVQGVGKKIATDIRRVITVLYGAR
ncbi:MAG: DEAD/DEAH box helicase [Candidatus Hydrothermarchaeota archaeon]|nr:DEAD/DEAH box helicase [Candidatus Hydrothermarchaeota archaeon]